MAKIDLRAKLNITDTASQIHIRRVATTAWEELAYYLECVAYLASQAIDEHPTINNRGEMTEYIKDYLDKAIPTYRKVK